MNSEQPNKFPKVWKGTDMKLPRERNTSRNRVYFGQDKKVYYDKKLKCVVILKPPNDYPYENDLERMNREHSGNAYQFLTEWLGHLQKKMWFTSVIMRHFVNAMMYGIDKCHKISYGVSAGFILMHDEYDDDYYDDTEEFDDEIDFPDEENI